MGGEVNILVLLMNFATARTRIPVMGLHPKITIEYLEPSKEVPDANARFHVLKLPTKHAYDFEAFSKAMKTALKHGCCSFGDV